MKRPAQLNLCLKSHPYSKAYMQLVEEAGNSPALLKSMHLHVAMLILLVPVSVQLVVIQMCTLKHLETPCIITLAKTDILYCTLCSCVSHLNCCSVSLGRPKILLFNDTTMTTFRNTCHTFSAAVSCPDPSRFFRKGSGHGTIGAIVFLCDNPKEKHHGYKCSTVLLN